MIRRQQQLAFQQAGRDRDEDPFRDRAAFPAGVKSPLIAFQLGVDRTTGVAVDEDVIALPSHPMR